MAGLNTTDANSVLEQLNESLRSALELIEALKFGEARELLDFSRAQLKAEIGGYSSPDELFLNDCYVLDAYVDFFFSYILLWEQVVNGKFSSSWDSLQNSLDLLRILKKFSRINITFFERQLIELEKLYPYRIFFSVGMTVGHFECSICGGDIYSPDCPHTRGMLYGGKMACAIARDIIEMDHVSMVANPEDKRCVPQYADNSGGFNILRYLALSISSSKATVLSFHHSERSKRKIPRSEFPSLGRNQLCFCGSKRKFKKCCLPLEETEVDHTQLVAQESRVMDAIPGDEYPTLSIEN